MKAWEDRITPEEIHSLPVGCIFVYGANTKWVHGRGAAKIAMKMGAKYGEGPFVGRTYGIPTKGTDLRFSLKIDQIKPYVDKFIEFAKEQPELTFLVTAIGTGLAGFTPKDIAPLFRGAMEIENINLPRRFWRVLQH